MLLGLRFLFPFLFLAGVLAGCDGGEGESQPADTTSPQLTIAPTAIVSDDERVRTDDFSFALPKGWLQVASGSDTSRGSEYLLSSASVSRPATAKSSLVVINAYDITPVADRYPWAPRDHAETYTDALDGRITASPVRMTVAGVSGDSYRLRFEIGGIPIRARVVRAYRDNNVIVVQCQAEPGDTRTIEAGCEAIVDSLRLENSS